MANGDDTTDQDEGQDVRPAPTMTPPPPAAVAPPMPIAMPGRAPIAPPPGLDTTLSVGGRQLPNWTGAGQLQMAQALQGVPIEQAQQAVQSAIQMQAQRGLSRDLQSGMDAAQAFQKWMPTLISARPPTLGQAADFIRAVRPPVQKPINVGGTLYNIAPGGQSVTVTPGQRVKPPEMSQLDKSRLADLVSNSRAIRRRFAAGTGTDQDRADLEANLNEERTILNRNRRPLQPTMQGSTQLTAIPQTSPQTAPQKVTTKAQFDSLAPGAIYIGKDGKRYRKPEQIVQASSGDQVAPPEEAEPVKEEEPIEPDQRY